MSTSTMSESALSRMTGEWTISANPRQRSAMGLLTLYLALLLAIPARLVFQPLGSMGTPAAILALGALVLWLGTRLVPSLNSQDPQPVRWALAFFALSVLASYLAGMLGALPVEETQQADEGLIKVAMLCGIALLAAEGIRDSSALETFIGRLVIGVTLVAIVGIIQFPTGLSLDFIQIPGLSANRDITSATFRGGFYRIQSTTLHPIELSVVLVMTLPLALYRAMAAPPGLVAKFRWGCVFTLLLALPMTISRTAFLCLAVVLAILMPTWEPKYVVGAVILGMLSILGIVVAVPKAVQIFYDMVVNIGSDYSFQGRTEDYALVGQFIYARPLFGRGFATFDPVKYILLDNQYLGILIELGAVGFMAVITMFLVGIGSARSARKHSTDPVGKARAHAVSASLAAAMASFAVFDAFAFPTATALVMLMLGCAGAAWRIAHNGEAPVRILPAPARTPRMPRMPRMPRPVAPADARRREAERV
jgi:polysaccharide biosynthesis protein PslJ